MHKRQEDEITSHKMKLVERTRETKDQTMELRMIIPDDPSVRSSHEMQTPWETHHILICLQASYARRKLFI